MHADGVEAEGHERAHEAAGRGATLDAHEAPPLGALPVPLLGQVYAPLDRGLPVPRELARVLKRRMQSGDASESTILDVKLRINSKNKNIIIH